MAATREFQLTKLAQIDKGIAMERRHVVEMNAQLDKARAMGWEEGMVNAGDLLAMAERRIDLLTAERAALAAEMSGERPPAGRPKGPPGTGT